MKTSSRLALRLAAAALLFGGVTALMLARGLAGPASKNLSLTWHGQSCFVLDTPGGARVVMDPIPAAIGYTPPTGLTADVVTVSHEHGDHNNVTLVGGEPRVLRGLTEDKGDWHTIRAKVKDVAIRTVGVFHDDKGGKERGKNAVFVFEVAGQRIAHLGNLGHELTEKQLREIGRVDVVLVPVGGVFTIDAAQASKVVEQLKPRTVVIPMHYRTDVLKIKELAPVDAFLTGKSAVRRETGNVLVLGANLGAAGDSAKGKAKHPEIVVLNYK